MQKNFIVHTLVKHGNLPSDSIDPYHKHKIQEIGGGGGFGGFFLACQDFWRMLDHSFPACTFFKWRLAHAH